MLQFFLILTISTLIYLSWHALAHSNSEHSHQALVFWQHNSIFAVTDDSNIVVMPVLSCIIAHKNSNNKVKSYHVQRIKPIEDNYCLKHQC